MPTSIKSHNEKPSSKKRKAVFLRAEKRILRDGSFVDRSMRQIDAHKHGKHIVRKVSER